MLTRENEGSTVVVEYAVSSNHGPRVQGQVLDVTLHVMTMTVEFVSENPARQADPDKDGTHRIVNMLSPDIVQIRVIDFPRKPVTRFS